MKFCCVDFIVQYANHYMIYSEKDGNWYNISEPDEPINRCGWCKHWFPGGEERAKKFGYDPNKPTKSRPVSVMYGGE